MIAPDLHPGRTLRVGVTGARLLDPEQQGRLQTAASALLQTIATGACAEGAVKLELHSPLAEGADRLVAHCALALDRQPRFTLFCPMPFRREDYQEDFIETPGSLEEFNGILERARPRVLELDGTRRRPLSHADGSPFTAEEQIRADRGERARAYEAVGRLIVRNCDLLIAVWDGLPGQGPGGTADTVRYAANFGPPVIWIHATDPNAPPRWIEEVHDLRHGADPRAVDAALTLYLDRLLTPPETGDDRGEGFLQKLGRGLDWICRKAAHPLRRVIRISHLEAFENEQPNPARGIWGLHSRMMRFMAGGQEAPWTEPREPEDETALQWFERYQKADGRAGESARRYRSSYVWVFVLGAIALVAAAFSLSVEEDQLLLKLVFTSVEFIVLILIALLVILDSKEGWHRRSIEYRLLAELCRKQQSLAPLGWVVPRASAWATTEAPPEPEEDAPESEPIPWVGWRFSAWLRDTKLPTGTVDSLWVEHARDAAMRDLLDDQIDYHTARRRQTHRAAKRLELWGEIAFFAVLVAVVWKLVLVCGHLVEPELAPLDAIHLLGLAGAVLPAASAAFVGIRAYAELGMLAEQSDGMLKALRLAKQQIKELDVKAPLASQSLGVALAGVATLMLEDLEGWARLFRGKVLDA